MLLWSICCKLNCAQVIGQIQIKQQIFCIKLHYSIIKKVVPRKEEFSQKIKIYTGDFFSEHMDKKN